MRTLSLTGIATALIAAAIAGPGVAASDCESVMRVAAHAQTDFKQITGPRSRPNSASYETTLTLPGATRCWIRRSSDRTAKYWCTWQVDRSRLRAEVETLAIDMARCFSVPTPEIEEFNQEPSAMFDTPDGITIYVAGNKDDATVDIALNRTAD